MDTKTVDHVKALIADATAKDDAVDLTVRHTIEIDGVDKPAAVADVGLRPAQ